MFWKKVLDLWAAWSIISIMGRVKDYLLWLEERGHVEYDEDEGYQATKSFDDMTEAKKSELITEYMEDQYGTS